LELTEQQLIIRLWPTNTTFDQPDSKIWLGYIGKQTLKHLPLLSIPKLASDFDSPIQQFKPFTAMLNWRIKHRRGANKINQPWKGEVIVLWSDSALGDNP
jgi:hypothetical protein